ncbi:hypothetical protein ACVFVO_18325 [Advenella kashmirensis]
MARTRQEEPAPLPAIEQQKVAPPYRILKNALQTAITSVIDYPAAKHHWQASLPAIKSNIKSKETT